MNINAANSVSGISGLNAPDSSSSVKGLAGSGEDFGSLIKTAVESIDGTQKSAEQAMSRAVTGESPDLHRTIIELQTADLKFQFGLQVRNKLIGAYEEIMRMQV